MTVNRLTDEKLQLMIDEYEYDPDHNQEIMIYNNLCTVIDELLTLRKENERLRMRVEVGEEIIDAFKELKIVSNLDHECKPHPYYLVEKEKYWNVESAVYKWSESGVE